MDRIVEGGAGAWAALVVRNKGNCGPRPFCVAFERNEASERNFNLSLRPEYGFYSCLRGISMSLQCQTQFTFFVRPWR